jgi:tetratricopeptide (TPR) repeat protein
LTIDGDLQCERLLAELAPLLSEPTADAPQRFSLAYQAVRSLSEESATPKRIEVFLSIARYYYLAAKPSAALEAASEAEALARHLDDRKLLRWSLSLVGLMQSETGNLPGATASLSEAIEIAKELQDKTAESRAWVNLGVSLIAAAQYSDSISSFERAIVLAEADEAGAQVRRNALTNIGLCALHLRDVRTGLRALNAEFKDAGLPKTAADVTARASAESVYARLLLDIGDIEGARKHADEARKFAQLSGTARAQLVATTALGLVDVY